MIKQINHIGIAVSSLENHIPFYRDILGLTALGTEEVPEHKVKVAMFQVGEVKIELLEPTSGESPVAKFIEKKGEGIHHIAYETDGIIKEIEGFQGKEIRMIDETPRDGAHGTKIAFIHPKSSGKVLTEICQSSH
ncbi:MAG: methylmalonyl-CoA epimerase [Deltaproteobacteria bacterium]|jgi:methylmalonyl-CoA/ethylmalonyl-CoA epimerase|nr:methylmalonyl-CoA epimerase [Deltaproteobacteria bacterium]MCD4764780.1 methylmalonyl-CoA epimerase [Desulfobacterales bacterium]MCD4788102.1 methylmalonyl-CoA epimerase [Desulfobacterales bacterium]